MKIAVFGANGGIGRWVVKYALERGYDVIACVRRRPSTPLGASGRLRVVVVNTEDKGKMEEALLGCHAAINSSAFRCVRFTRTKPPYKPIAA